MPGISILTPTIRPQGLEIVQKCLAEQTFQDFEWLVEVGIPERGHDLCKALNRMLKRAKYDFIVMLQDYISILPDGLERFLKVADEKKFITGAMGITPNWKTIKWDWRAYKQGFQEIQYYEWEEDWAIAPKKAFFEVGGYDEEYDNYWAMGNVNIAFRAMKLGYTFWVLPDNKAIQWQHDKFQKHPFRDRYFPIFHQDKIRKIEMGESPLILNYLK